VDAHFAGRPRLSGPSRLQARIVARAARSPRKLREQLIEKSRHLALQAERPGVALFLNRCSSNLDLRKLRAE
jgi:hypothetical protein